MTSLLSVSTDYYLQNASIAVNTWQLHLTAQSFEAQGCHNLAVYENILHVEAKRIIKENYEDS